MRMSFVIVIIFGLLALACDAYIYNMVRRTWPRRHWPRRLVLWSAVLLYAMMAVAVVMPWLSDADGTLCAMMWMLTVFISVYAAKFIFVIFALIARLPRLCKRRPWHGVTIAGGCLALLAFGLFWWGALINRFNLQVREVTVEIPSLPKSFDGLRIVQISDLHVGTYAGDASHLQMLVDTVNALHPDIILFTGDIVNRRSRELPPFIPVLSKLMAPMGVYAILGNHDFGDYTRWEGPDDQAADIATLEGYIADCGWKLLRNEHAWLRNGTDSIALVGVDNVGDPPFHVYGDLGKAYPTLADSVPKILLSHNPAHWCNSICDNPGINIALTLSGHTHAMQAELLNLSPAALRYRTWGGLYTDRTGAHTLYVNIGYGTVGMPARIGATPEITVITLKSK